MNKEETINSFLVLREVIIKLAPDERNTLFSQAAAVNPWYTHENIKLAFDGLCHMLNEDDLRTWAGRYPWQKDSKKTGIVMAGNVPLVGFHDLLCVLLAGHKAVVKLSSQDEVLPTFIIRELEEINTDFKERIEIVERLRDIEAVIATGSDNSARYFKKYFNAQPHIIRKNRTSVAVLDGKETDEELIALGRDIFSYFGMGCRNVAKVFVPRGYEMRQLIDHLETWTTLANHPKYFNNYEYNKAIYLVNRVEHLDNGFALFRPSNDLVSPLSVVYYEEYNSPEELEMSLQGLEDKLQCIIGNIELKRTMIPFGKAQTPDIDDYADNVDTMEFLSSL